jgi:hypothetical protein
MLANRLRRSRAATTRRKVQPYQSEATAVNSRASSTATYSAISTHRLISAGETPVIVSKTDFSIRPGRTWNTKYRTAKTEWMANHHGLYRIMRQLK